MGDRFACHTVAGSGIEGCSVRPEPGSPDDGAGHDWVDTVAALDDCDGYVVLMVDPQTAEVDAHGPFGGPDAAVAAEGLRASLDAEGLDDVAVRIVRLHLPTDRPTGPAVA
ncbi:hypothetical protein [Actinomycetospora sp. TBRC 11914]|uniref:hypothetical protein n=1 Tax=Actinomycetospora sp. TBRC 11914 TaxID=2729387 RepID=UPI00145CA79C|nr:hypothetical protein [Actinomycetospora sp. TBRC 11914]NMO92502.1 hypothetical protein [Actinomycetospora sp. TBRC 11914]